MAIRVTTTNRKGITIGAPYAVQLLEKSPELKGLKQRLKEKLEAKYQQHATNALHQVGVNLGLGFEGIETGAQPTIVAQDGDGKPLRVQAYRAWPPLTLRYARRKPRSTRFWKKRGQLAGNYAAATSGGAEVEAVEDKSRVRSHHKNKVRVAFTLQVMDNSHEVINSTVLKPFVSGDSGAAEFVTLEAGYRNRVDVLAFPELGKYRRPFVAQLSAALGRRALTALRRL